ncbi:TetR/AcrR family transcriptional regulator [Chryseobacterium koreense]|uniref:TetR/AcrR family transcriptional regulator n=1 Tax=Chryseobacterium koreense TaxID=232216 RepID=UPI0026EA4C36|nr:TetR/AcrR family transcriptional regulator [Chryseobacterium koreense]
MRKMVSGPIRDKERTKAKLIKTIGKIIKTGGFQQLKVTKIAKTAGVDRKLIYEYFGTVENLVNEYLRLQDYGSSAQKMDFSEIDFSDSGKEYSKTLIANMWDALAENKELQKIIIWELSEHNEILRNLSDHREELGMKLFNQVMLPYFKENEKKYRAILAILISATYYLSLHAESNGSLFAGLDIHQSEDRQTINEAVKDIIDMAYEKYK